DQMGDKFFAYGLSFSTLGMFFYSFYKKNNVMHFLLGLLASFIFILSFARDVFVRNLRKKIATTGQILSVNSFGKLKTTAQMITLSLLFCYSLNLPLFQHSQILNIGVLCILISMTIITITLIYMSAKKYNDEAINMLKI
ncbi:MAG: hypothetical protein OXR68_01995, partial [Alphaproteobacteria bacterium]|nr:hypothetical protein [Alphaproteobacteria bacterium]